MAEKSEDKASAEIEGEEPQSPEPKQPATEQAAVVEPVAVADVRNYFTTPFESGKKRRKKRAVNSILMKKGDRRTLANVPDPEGIRMGNDRRGNVLGEYREKDFEQYIRSLNEATRYIVELDAKIKYSRKKKMTRYMEGKIIDLSMTGALMQLGSKELSAELEQANKMKITFRITPGALPEGYEMLVRMKFTCMRFYEKDGIYYVGIEFAQPLSAYATYRKNRFSLAISSLMLFLITSVIMLMRAESFIYFKFNKWLYLYSIMAMLFLLSRYLLGVFYKPVPIDPEYTPGVTVIIPCFNEEEWIARTIQSCVNQDYPIDKLEVLIVDDCSTDNSVQRIEETIEILSRGNARFRVKERVRLVMSEKNGGKREALSLGALQAKHELLVFVDSDSFLDVFAIRNLVQPFKDPKIGGVSGRTDVANTYENGLTKMQAVRYYIAFRIMKAAEAVFDTVTCLSGPLSCYRKQIVLDNMEAWRNQKFLGQRATFGDDRSMTNFVLRKHRTSYQDTAVCSTIVPNKYSVFLKQQMRWKRSWLRESIVAGKYIWKKEPFSSLLFYIGLVVPVAAPIVVLYNLIYVPITHRVFPLTFLVGILMMSLLMSAAQLFLRKSSTWVWGMLFCFYYEVVLLWQMPVAWVTFWKSTWGTRMTPEDVKEAEKKKQQALEREQKKLARRERRKAH